MRDFSPHAILRSPLTPDETVERMIQAALIRRGGKGPVILLIDPVPPTLKDEPSSRGQWRVPAEEKPSEVEEEPPKE